jgi:hypothetical protein
MITKISSNEYLRRVDNMDVAERDVYLKRVGEWLKTQAPLLMARANDDVARFQNAIQCSAMWNDDECRAWEDGARLLTAMAGKTDTWLPDMLYVKAAKRSIGQMISVIKNEELRVKKDTGAQAKPLPKDSGRMQVAKAKEAGYVAPFRGVDQGNHDGEGEPQNTEAQKVITPLANREGQGVSLPVRPKHIDQYVHLLPQKTQEKAATVKGLLRDLDVAREKMRLLMDDQHASDDSRAQWAKTVTKLDEKVNAIYKELDAEWEKLVQSGRVTVDDLGNAHVLPDADATGAAAAERNNGITELRNNREEVAAKEKRIEYLKKWLRDSRTKASDERKEQWEQNCRELLSLGGELTDSIRKAGEHYGVNLDDITK